MDLSQYKDFAIPIASFAVAVLGTLTTLNAASDRRTRLKADVDLLDQLEPDSKAHEMLKFHIDWQINQICLAEMSKNRVRLALALPSVGITIFAVLMIAAANDVMFQAIGFLAGALAILWTSVILADRYMKD